jgi:hypothetical protein
MPTVEDLARELRHKGAEKLFEEYPASSVLIGLGILGIASDQAERTRRGTVRFNKRDAAEYLKAASLVGRVWFLTKKRENRQKSQIIVGRTSEADVVIPELSISVEHCALQATPFGLSVIDLNSTNGTFVNGERVQKGVQFSLYDGAKLALGRFEFEYLRHRFFLERLKQVAMQRPAARN